MTCHTVPIYSPIRHVTGDMWLCSERAEGHDDREPLYVIRPQKACSRCGIVTVNWVTVSVKKADGGILDLCRHCHAVHRGYEPLPLEETA